MAMTKTKVAQGPHYMTPLGALQRPVRWGHSLLLAPAAPQEYKELGLSHCRKNRKARDSRDVMSYDLG